MAVRKVIVIGELNVDLIMNKAGKFPAMGKEVLAGDMKLTLGSSSAIFANNLSVLGADVGFVGKVGNDAFGQLVIDSLSANGVDTGAIISDEGCQTGVTVAMNFGNDRAMVTYPGAMEHFGIADVDWGSVSKAGHLHVSSVFLQPKVRTHLVAMFAKAKELGLTTSFDTQWDPEEKWQLPLEEILPLVDIFLPNEVEIRMLTGCKDVEDSLRCINGFSNVVVVKLGQKGSLSSEKGVLTHIPSFLNMEVVDAIGAGDSFNAGFVYKFLSGNSIKECQVFGNLIGAISTTAAGGTGAFTSRNDVMEVANVKFKYSENDTKG